MKAVLFDFDGTLADTAPDLASAINAQRMARQLAPLPLEQLRPVVSHGARGMLRLGFDLAPGQPQYEAMREEFLERYFANICVHTWLFDGVAALLADVETRGIAWGIVTNKPHRFTTPIVRALALDTRAACVISGDTTAHAKPHPDPLLEAARRIGLDPAQCLYVGDDERDVQAALAADMTPAVALWGYLGDGNPPERWGAPHMLEHPKHVLELL